MSPLIAHVADIHAREKDLRAFALQWRATCLKIASRKCAAVLLSGDVFDKSVIGNASAAFDEVATVVNDSLDIIPRGVPIMGCCGNHDYRTVNATPRTLACPRIYMAVNRHEWREILPAVWVLLFPWQWDGDAASALMRESSNDMPKAAIQSPVRILCAHVQVDGANMGNGRACGADESPDAPTDRPGVWRVSRGLLLELTRGDNPVFHRICLGDFHARQDLTEGRGGYGGALRQCNRGEMGNPQGFEIIDTDTMQAEWVEVSEYPAWETCELGCLPVGNVVNVVVDDPTLTAAEIADLERRGATVIRPKPIAPERQARCEPIPEGAVNDPHALLRIGAEAGLIEPGELDALDKALLEFTAGNGAVTA